MMNPFATNSTIDKVIVLQIGGGGIFLLRADTAGMIYGLGFMLIIARVVYEVMLAHSRLLHPEEVCGFLAGRDNRAARVYIVENVLHRPDAFRMNPRQQIMTMLDAEEKNQPLLAVYHSHPAGPPHPSPTDVARAYYPELLQVVISLVDTARPVTAAFSIVDRRIAPASFIIE